MTEVERRQIHDFRLKGAGYKAIAAALGVSRDSVRGYCKRSGCGGESKAMSLKVAEVEQTSLLCPCCGRGVTKNSRGRIRRFCSDECRRKWWSDHMEARSKKETAIYSYTCPRCGKAFSAYGDKTRKYCSHDCYIKARFWIEKTEEGYSQGSPIFRNTKIDRKEAVLKQNNLRNRGQ